MSGEDEKKRYQQYLVQKQTLFGVEAETVEGIIQSVIGTSVARLKRIIAGEINEVYEVGTESGNYILRISSSSRTRFLTEKWATDRVRKKDVPAPNIFYVGEINLQGETLKMCVEDKIPGIALSELVGASQLLPRQLESIYFQAGMILAKIHSVEPRGYGKISEFGVGKYASWNDYVLKYACRDRGETYALARKASVLPGVIDHAVEVLKQYETKYGVVTPHLLHCDFSPKHWLVVGDQISGIVDFENCLSGDPIYDLAWLAYFDEDLTFLKKGYLVVSNLPGDYELKLKLYGLRIGLDLIRWYAIENHTIGMTHAKAKMIEDLSYFGKE